MFYGNIKKDKIIPMLVEKSAIKLKAVLNFFEKFYHFEENYFHKIAKFDC
jgi:hypothetical protein